LRSEPLRLRRRHGRLPKKENRPCGQALVQISKAFYDSIRTETEIAKDQNAVKPESKNDGPGQAANRFQASARLFLSDRFLARLNDRKVLASRTAGKRKYPQKRRRIPGARAPFRLIPSYRTTALLPSAWQQCVFDATGISIAEFLLFSMIPQNIACFFPRNMVQSIGFDVCILQQGGVFHG